MTRPYHVRAALAALATTQKEDNMSYYLNTQEEAQAWRDYLQACEEDGLNGFSLHQWRIHGCPDGPCPALMEARG